MLIKLIHEIPPQHRIEKSAGTRTLKAREREEFERYVSLKLGYFSESEDERLKKIGGNFARYISKNIAVQYRCYHKPVAS